MSAIKTEVLTVDDFLTLPELRPALEFYGGRVIQKMSPRLPHSVIQGDLLIGLHAYGKATGVGRAYLELRCTFGGSSHVFDLSFFRNERLPNLANAADRDQIRRPPDLAIEILSPGQTVGELSRKLRSAIRRGVKLGWLIHIGRREVHVFRPTGKPGILRVGDILDDADILPGFALPITELFGSINGQ